MKIKFRTILLLSGATCIVAITCVPCFAESKTVMASSRAKITSVLELAVSQQGTSEIRFGNIRPSAIDATVAGPISVQVDVTCNTGEKYQVVQQINGPLSALEGYKIDPNNLTFKSTPEKTRGFGVSKLTPVMLSPQVIFSSDAEGNSEHIIADYYLNVPASQEAGNYSSSITYTVSTV